MSRSTIILIVAIVLFCKPMFAVCGCSGGTIDSDGTGPCLEFDDLHLLGDPIPAEYLTRVGFTDPSPDTITCGFFANGTDVWILNLDSGASAVVVNAITPAPTTSPARNGWEVNPTQDVLQPYDDRIPNTYNVATLPSLPYSTSADESLVFTTSWVPSEPGGPFVWLYDANILTVLAADPGATAFRPAYFGTTKTIYDTTSLQTGLLKQLPLDVSGAVDAPDFTTYEHLTRRVWLDHITGPNGRFSHPGANLNNYGGNIARDIGRFTAFLHSDNTLGAKNQLLIQLVQIGIDFYGMWRGGDGGANGTYWPAAGGHTPGRKLAMEFAAVMLDDATMIANLTAAANTTVSYGSFHFSEDEHVSFSAVADGGSGKVLYGQIEGATAAAWESNYWVNHVSANHKSGSRDIRDPYGYEDGKSYIIVNAGPFLGAALNLYLLTEVRTVWNYDYFLDFVNRWMTFGRWHLPDPCAHTDPVTYIGVCVADSGRHPLSHGADAGVMNYGTAWLESYWDVYGCDASEDADSDIVCDKGDRCTDISNLNQLDTDGDGYGNACDADFDQDGDVDGEDFLVHRQGIIDNASGITDHDGDGGTDGADFILFRNQFLQGSPGPAVPGAQLSGEPAGTSSFNMETWE